jgi:diguanylate cyclase (GGDEF)-like protein
MDEAASAPAPAPTFAPQHSRMKSLGARLVVFFVVLLVIVQGLGAFLVIRQNSQIARQTIDQELSQGERVFKQLLAQRQARLEQAAAILSADFAFRQAIATNNTGTIVSVLRNHGARVGSTVMTLVDLDKAVRADSRDDNLTGRPFMFPALVDVAAATGKASSIVLIDGRVQQLVVVPVLAPDPIAYVGLGFEVDDAVARELNLITGLEVTFLSRMRGTGWRIHSSTVPAGLRDELVARFGMPVEDGAGGFRSLELAGESYEARSAPLAHDGGAEIVALLQKSLAIGLAPFRRISQSFFWLTLAGLALLVAGSLLIARSITKPVSKLVDAARRVQAGDYKRHVEVDQQDEIGELAVSFNHMLDGIESREREILRLAYEDGLTGLPNRAMFNKQLDQAIRTARRGASPLSVLLFDMDRFKAINDTLGHPVGDQALREVGQRVRRTLRDSDVVARLGGDEFAVLLATGGTTPRVVADKIMKELEEPFVVDGQQMDVAASIGVAIFPDHGADAPSLLRAADVAMYDAKRSKMGYTMYDPTHDERRQEFLTLLGELRRAVESGELVLHYQPKVSLSEDRVSAVEALVRWDHPARGFVPPAEFIPFAEQTGYISQITRWVLGRAIEQCGKWHRAGLNVRMCVNISARDLRMEDTLVQYAWAALLEAEVPPGMLCLEITESGLMDDPKSAQSTLRKLRDLGIETSIDDYGTGYSSLAYIKQLAVNELKIDRGFVAGMEADKRNAAIVRSTIELGHNLGLTVVAEGVETEHELSQLRRFGCDVAQGYHLGKPMSPEALEAWLGASAGRTFGSRPVLRDSG